VASETLSKKNRKKSGWIESNNGKNATPCKANAEHTTKNKPTSMNLCKRRIEFPAVEEGTLDLTEKTRNNERYMNGKKEISEKG